MSASTSIPAGLIIGPVLPDGVEIRRLEPHRDERGALVELFRETWGLTVAPVQWNAVRSDTNVLRGVHAHWRHEDYLTVVLGRATVGLYDLRQGSPTEGMADAIELVADSPAAIVIPTGVAHGFYFHEPSLHVYAVSHEWDPADELGCRWDDPALGIPWPRPDPVLSQRDAELGTLDALRASWHEALEATPA